MIYCAQCTGAVMKRTLFGSTVLLCPNCGAIYEQTGERKYRYVGSTKGNQQLRELLPYTDEEEPICDCGTQN